MFTKGHGQIKIFSGNSNLALATAIAHKLNIKMGTIEVGRFSDGEVSVNIKESVRGGDVFVVQSTSRPVNENLMELLVIVDALKRASAGRITAVVPYFGYARQDRKARARDPISAKLVADILQVAGINRLLTMDLHSPQQQGFFDIPVDNLLGMPVLHRHLAGMYKDRELTVVSPDIGSVTRSRLLAQKLDAPLAIVDKRRPRANVMEVMNIIGDVKGRDCVMIDDMIDTAGTICQGAQALMDVGAKSIVACCSHGVLSGTAIERLEASPIEKVILLDTINQPVEKLTKKFTVVSVAEIFAEAVERIYADLPVSKLYE